MRFLGSLLIFVFLFVAGSAHHLQAQNVAGGDVPIVLNLKSPLVSGNSVKLGYDIPYPGYIEFHLYDAEGNKIWANYGVREKGEHYQALRADKLDAGITYTYEFWYKGKPYEGKFSI